MCCGRGFARRGSCRLRAAIEITLFWIIMSPVIAAAYLLRGWTDGDVAITAAIVVPWLAALFTAGVIVDIRRGRYRFRAVWRYPAKVAGFARLRHKRG